MWWKFIINWLREKVDVDVDLTVEGGDVCVAVTLKVGEVTVFTDHFEWPLPSPDQPLQLTGKVARRKRLVPQGG